MENLSVNILVREEKEDGKKIFIVNNEETGVADSGETMDEAIENFKKSLRLFLEAYPEKEKLFVECGRPVLVSRICL